MGTEIQSPTGFIILRHSGGKTQSLSRKTSDRGYFWVDNEDPKHTAFVHSRRAIKRSIRGEDEWVKAATDVLEGKFDPEKNVTFTISGPIPFLILQRGFKIAEKVKSASESRV